MTAIQHETPMEFFKEQVENAIARQNLQSSEDTKYYLTQLLDDFVRFGARQARAGMDPDEPLATIYCHALSSHGHRRYELLKLTGDLALFISGFLPESLNRALVGAGYYVHLGGQAYGVIGAEYQKAAWLFDELATHFAQFADVLSDVSERCALTDESNLLRLYERWLATGSQHSAELLREQGILVVPTTNTLQ